VNAALMPFPNLLSGPLLSTMLQPICSTTQLTAPPAQFTGDKLAYIQGYADYVAAVWKFRVTISHNQDISLPASNHCESAPVLCGS